MNLTRRSLLSLLLLAAFAPPLLAQIQPICDVECRPDPSGSGYTALFTARTTQQNARGAGARTVPVFNGGEATATVTLYGSQSYDFSQRLIELPGRGGLDVDLTLYYNSRLWTTFKNLNRSSVAFNADVDSPGYGFRLDYGDIEYNADTDTAILIEADGTKHLLHGPAPYVTWDATYVQWDSAADVVRYAGGTQVYYEPFPSNANFHRPIRIEDTNGNYITVAYAAGHDLAISTITDTVGRVITFTYDAGGHLSSVTQGAKTFRFTWNTSYALTYAFSIQVLGSPAAGTPIAVLTGVQFPDQTSLNFVYGDWGIVTRIDRLSSLNVLRWSTSYNYPHVADGTLADSPTYTQQTTFDGVNTAVWNFTNTRDATTGQVTSSSVQGPTGAVMTSTFSTAAGDMNGVTLTTNTYDAASVLLRGRTNTWSLDAGGHNPHVTTAVNTLENGEQTTLTFAWDASGNMTDEKEYDFGTSAPGPLLRETVMTYAALPNHILNRMTQMVINDGAGHAVTRADFHYDEYATYPLQTLSPAPQLHDTARYPDSGGVRGNMTSVTQYTNAAAGTGPITRGTWYDVVGNIVKAEVDASTEKRWTYTSATQYAYPETITSGPVGTQLTSGAVWNFDSATLAAAIDESGRRTSYAYDVADRVTRTTLPDGTVVSSTYDDAAAQPNVVTATTASNLVQKRIIDGEGRTIAEEVWNSATLVSRKTMTYDAAGRALTVSNPYGPNDTPVSVSYSYDVLGRIISVTPAGGGGAWQTAYAGHTITYTDPKGIQKRRTIDGLGRLAKVEEPSLTGGASGNGSVSVSGSEQSVATSSGNGATAATASVTVTPTTAADRSTSVLTHAATVATGSVTISGFENSTTIDPCADQEPTIGGDIPSCPRTIYDSGSVTVTIGGIAKTVGYGQFSDANGIAGAIASAFAGSASFTVTSSANVVSVRAQTAGAAGNGITLAGSSQTGDFADFGGPSFTATPSGSTLTGGTDNGYTTVYDTGTVSLSFTVNNVVHTESVPYGRTDTGLTLASALATKLNSDPGANTLVIASASSNIVSLTTVATGAGTAYPLSASAVTNSSNFPAGTSSFTAAASGSTFTPGANGTLYDAGTVTVSVTGFTIQPFTKTVNYSQGSTAASVAAGVAAAFHNDPFSPVDGAISTSSATSVVLTARDQGSDTNYGLTVSSSTSLPNNFSSASFTLTSAALTGGVTGTPTLSPALVTTYSYDAANRMLSVTAGAQQRTYQYDDMGRLLSEALPETGNRATTFTYNQYGRIAQRTDPRGVVTTYTYDGLQRPLTVHYSDGTPDVGYTYGPSGATDNSAGRLVQITDGAGSQSIAYNADGVVSRVTRRVAGIDYPISYAYDASGVPSAITYPSGHVVTMSHDGIERLTQVAALGTSVATIAPGDYDAAGHILRIHYGDGLTGAFTYNPQEQITAISYSTPSGDVLKLSYDYGALNTGRVQNVTDVLAPARSATYAYDELGRLSRAQTADQTSANTWKLKFTFDRYGNRLSELPIGGTSTVQPFNRVLVDPATNHITSGGVTYDNAGNVTNDGAHRYAWDAENRLTGVDGAANVFGYDAAGLRVTKPGTVYIYSGRDLIAEYASGAAAGSPRVEYIHAAGQLAASISNGVFTYYYADTLSNRLGADASGTVNRTYGHFPFGEDWYETGAASKWKFTTYERDTDSTGLDYAQARFFSPMFGRFLSTDPVNGNPIGPQSWNRYSYVQNDPINFLDPTGLSPRGHHENLTFLIGVLLGYGDPDGLAKGAGDADDFFHSATGLFGLGVFINGWRHFGEPQAIDHCWSPRHAGFEMHRWEDIGPGAPHFKFKPGGLLPAIGNVFRHIFLGGAKVDRAKNVNGFEDAFNELAKSMGVKDKQFPREMFQYILNVVDEHQWDIVGISICTSTDSCKSHGVQVDPNTMTFVESQIMPDGTLVQIWNFVVDDVNPWNDPNYYMLLGFDDRNETGVDLYEECMAIQQNVSGNMGCEDFLNMRPKHLPLLQ